jgi:nitrogen fixation protein NifU and related proteins
MQPVPLSPDQPFGRSTIAPMYSQQLLDHFQNPRHAGELPRCDASAQVENPACGDVLRLSANIRDGKIEEIRFKAKGCVPAMACGSAVAELLAGRTLAEAKELDQKDLVHAVGGLPEASTHAVHLALDAVATLLKSSSPAG